MIKWNVCACIFGVRSCINIIITIYCIYWLMNEISPHVYTKFNKIYCLKLFSIILYIYGFVKILTIIIIINRSQIISFNSRMKYKHVCATLSNIVYPLCQTHNELNTIISSFIFTLSIFFITHNIRKLYILNCKL